MNIPKNIINEPKPSSAQYQNGSLINSSSSKSSSSSIFWSSKTNKIEDDSNNKSISTLLRISYQRRMISCKTALGKESLSSLNVDKAMLKAFSRTKARLYRTKLNYSNHLICQEVSSKPPKLIPTFFVVSPGADNSGEVAN
jgi:hypothetical protein